jgi:ketosteroid isomerase-like protein
MGEPPLPIEPSRSLEILPGMKEGNAEIVRKFVATGEQTLTYVDPDVYWNPVEEPASQGHDAVRDYLRRWTSGWDRYETTCEDLVEQGNRVLATVRHVGRGKGSGIEVEARFYELFTLKDGKITRMDEFDDRAEAMEALGEPA